MEARPFRAADVTAMLALANHAALAGEAELEPRTQAQLAAWLDAPETDPARDVALWGDPAPRAYARVEVGPRGAETHAMLSYAIGLAADHALEAAIVRWAARRLLEERSGGRPLRLTHDVGHRDPARRGRLAALGFAVHRVRHDMARPTAPALDAPLPPGFRVRPVDAATEAAAYVALFNAAFADAHDGAPLDEARFRHDAAQPDYRAAFDLVLETPTGELAGCCYVTLDPATPHLGYIATVAVHRAWRRQGLAAALVAVALAALDRAGATTASLHVDDDSPSAAPRLYRRLGFTVRVTETRLAVAGQALVALTGS